MNMRQRRLVTLLLSTGGAVIAIALLAFISHPVRADGSGDKRFAVHASIVAESLGSSDYPKGMFLAETTVTNVSGIDQEIVVWTQYGWSWLSNNKAVQPGIEATKNYPTRSVLSPGQKYVAKVELSANPRSRRPLTFRLGFCPTPEGPISGMRNATSQVVAWSNDVVLDR